MSEQEDGPETVEVEEVSRDLVRALKLCHSVVDDYRLKFAANLQVHQPANDDEIEFG